MLHQDISLHTSTVADGNLAYRYGDEREVKAARAAFLKKCGSSVEQSVLMDVVHGDTIVLVNASHRGTGMHLNEESSECDAFITKSKNLTLFLLTADCLPIAFYDPVQKIAALAHLGWKSTDKKLSQKVVEQMLTMGSLTENMLVYFGPGIHKESYIKKEPDQLGDPKWEPYLEKQPDGQYSIDIVQYNLDQLIEVQIPKTNIEISDVDTGSNANYFSHYRSRTIGEKEGRIATILTIL